MNFKIDTKEKMHVIQPEELVLSANMTEEMKEIFLGFLNQPIKNVIIDMGSVVEIDTEAAKCLVEIQQQFYEQNQSFVICKLQKLVENFLDEEELLELMNTTPTESEAWDIVQIEEIERELF